MGKHDPYLHHSLVVLSLFCLLNISHLSAPLLPSLIVYFSFIGSAFSPHLMTDTSISLQPNLPHSSNIWCPLHTPTPLSCSTLQCIGHPNIAPDTKHLLMVSFKSHRAEYVAIKASTLHSSGKGIQFMKIGCRNLLSFSQEAIREDGPDEIFHTKAGKTLPPSNLVACCRPLPQSCTI